MCYDLVAFLLFFYPSKKTCQIGWFISVDEHHLYVVETTKLWQNHDWSQGFLRFRFKAGIVDVVIGEFLPDSSEISTQEPSLSIFIRQIERGVDFWRTFWKFSWAVVFSKKLIMESETPTHTIHVWYISCICPYISLISMVKCREMYTIHGCYGVYNWVLYFIPCITLPGWIVVDAMIRITVPLGGEITHWS